jgi:carbonic anhydrase/acetyltransferase-like protein (isoleucine patch superfamily)
MEIDRVFHPEKVHPTAFVAPGAAIIGDVSIGEMASVWFGAVLRGDVEPIIIGEQSNVQDGCILHTDPGAPSILGKRVTMGHGAIVHGATVEDDVLIGMRATILNGARIGRGSLIAAGALVAPGTIVPPGSLVMGIPGKVVRAVGEAEEKMIRDSAEHYVEYSRAYLAQYPGR